ncbi:MAG: universal stress protein, partial [Pseudomonadota bacterium]
MKPTVTHILFTTDLSKNSTYALTHAASMAQATGAKLHVLHEHLQSDARIVAERLSHMQDMQLGTGRLSHAGGMG